MKVTLTAKEILAKCGLPADTELVIELGQDQDGDSSKWISNIGNTRAHYPDSLSYDTEIEVKFRNGETETDYADNWGTSWIDEGEDWDIVAYQIL